MQSILKYKKVLLVVLVIAVLFVVYSFMVGGEEEPEGLTSRRTEEALPEEAGDLIALLAEVKSIKLDTAVFENEVFLTLKDFTVDLVEQPIGRRNPFAPLGAAPVGDELPVPEDSNQ